MKTPEQRLAERGKRLWKNYHWTLAMVDDLFRLQDGRCAICGRKLNGYNVDHEHFSIKAYRNLNPLCPPELKWFARAIFSSGCWEERAASTKSSAIEAVKEIALPLSVRGLLCPGRHGKAGHGCCNRLLGRVDNQVWLRAAADYLDNPPAKKILLDKTPTI